MTSLDDLGATGTKRQTWSGDTPRAVYLRIKQAHPDATVEERASILMKKVRKDDDLLLPILIHYTMLQDRNSEYRPVDRVARAERAKAAHEEAKRLIQRAMLTMRRKRGPRQRT